MRLCVLFFLKVVDCGQPASPTNGQVTVSGTAFESAATYTCNSGYIPTRSTTRICRADGLWSPLPPECKRMCSYCKYMLVPAFTMHDSSLILFITVCILSVIE